MHRSVVSITLNPSIDVTLWADGMDPDKANRVERETREVGGKGINVSRVVHSFGLQTLCLSVAGEDNCEEFAQYLEKESLRYEFIKIAGAVRENLTLRWDGQTIKLNRRGPALSAMMIGALMALIRSWVRPGDIVVFAGSLPEHVSVDDYVELILAVKSAGVLIAVDSDELSLENYRRIAPWLIKPNIHELRHISPLKGDSIDDVVDSARTVNTAGAENVLVSLGGHGMVYVSKEATIRAEVPAVEVKSTVGAGDSSLAGYLVGFMKGMAPAECVRLAAACGTASAMQDGTLLAARDTAGALLDRIRIQEI